VFGIDDLGFLRESEGAFARKFGPADQAILDELDKIVLDGSVVTS
jgi:hypothetical protein